MSSKRRRSTPDAQPRATARTRPSGRAARTARTRRVVVFGAAAIAVVVAVQLVAVAMRGRSAPGEWYRSQGNVHVSLGSDTPAYNSDPPTSGWHTPELASWGSHLDPVPDQRVIHNMEDGGVVLWYAAGTPEENAAHVAALEDVVGGAFSRIVIAPREGMPTTYALTAWQRLQRFDAIDPKAMRTFVRAYHGRDQHAR